MWAWSADTHHEWEGIGRAPNIPPDLRMRTEATGHGKPEHTFINTNRYGETKSDNNLNDKTRNRYGVTMCTRTCRVDLTSLYPPGHDMIGCEGRAHCAMRTWTGWFFGGVGGVRVINMTFIAKSM